MTVLDPDRWQRLSPLLDEALELPLAARAVWLERLAVAQPDLAAELKALLDADAASAAARFLSIGGVAAPASAAGGEASSLVGQTLGAYTLVAAIGQGGMGSVWLAQRSDGRFKGNVAVKLLNASLMGRAGGDRFKREGSILARLTHPHIARLFDAGVSSAGQPYLVLEHVQGERIDRHCDSAQLDVAARVRLFIDVLGAVAHSHAHLIVHRDIKPPNVLVDEHGGVKLLDFGIAKLLEDGALSGEATELTHAGGRAMTPQYATPEQMLGEPVTIGTDVYALGLLLYVLLSGQHPAGGHARSTAELVRTIVEVEAPRLSDTVRSARQTAAALADNAAERGTTPDRLQRLLQGDLDNIVAKALKKNPAERYATVDAFAEDLKSYLAHRPVSARADSLIYRAGKFARRNRASVAAGVLAVGAMCAGLFVSLWQAGEARHQRDRALTLLARSNAVTDFFEFLLTDAGPPDKPQTINSLMARSDSLLRNEFGGNPEQQAAILQAQASYYLTLGDPAQAEPKLRRALAQLREVADNALRAEISCLHGFSLSLLGQRDAGVQQIEATLREPALPAYTTVVCLENRAFIAENESDGAATARHAGAAYALLKKSEQRYPRLEASLLGDLAYAEQLQGHNDAANRLYVDALAKLTAIGRDRTPLAVSMQNNWALASLGAGDIRRALMLYEQSARAVRERDPQSPLPGYLSANLARSLELMGRYPEALQIYAQATADATKAGRLDSRLFGLLGSASAYCELGDIDRAGQALAEAIAAMQGVVPADSPPALTAAAISGRIALARGELDDAGRLFGKTIASHEAHGRGQGGLVMLYLYRSEVGRRQHEPARALADARHGLALARGLQGGIAHSSRTGLALLAMAEALHDQGQAAAAQAALADAVAHLTDALGADHPATLRALALQSNATASR
ncbi:MAG: serine/threonine-protein kinase [Pseudomonadota bacterium]|nr:serine/threonine-protein kinase [Pseudomonadota bacterium]